ncbi:MAG TPA: hypothetical protein VMK31_00825 [Sphingomicrobium sp.]|nr:hypothetical protein [Sphingomicrobium sp.]
MSPEWSYFWPVAALALLCGALAGLPWFRRNSRRALAIGIAVTFSGAALWHWPLGAADRLVAAIEPPARAVLVDWEMGHIEGRLARGPLTRKLILSGPADRFQREQLVLMMSTLPGVSAATWAPKRSGTPLILESAFVATVGFLLGLLLAYGVELRRRHNAQWKW